MVLPQNSPYSHLFDGLPNVFKEDIRIYKRTKTGESDYNRPVFSEEPIDVRGRVDIQDAPDLTAEEGGLRATRTAMVFLPLPSEFEDLFDRGTPGSPEDLLPSDVWKRNTLIGATPKTDGSYLFTDPASSSFYDVETIDRIAIGTFKATVGHRLPSPKWNGITAPQFQFSLRNTDTQDNIVIIITEDDPSLGTYIQTQTTNAGAGPEVINTTNIVGGWIDDSEIIVERNFDNVTITIPAMGISHVHNTTFPDRTVPLSIDIFGSNNQVAYVKVRGIDTVDFAFTDQYEFRGRRWAQMEQPRLTHLQTEITLQEVIPDG